MENFPTQYQAIQTRIQHTHQPWSCLEKDIFHITHVEVSGFLLRLWGVNESIVEAVFYQDQPWQTGNPGEITAATLLYLARYYALKAAKDPAAFDLNRDYIQSLECGESLTQCERLVEEKALAA